MISKVCVFCGSSMGTDPSYRAAAVAMGEELVRRDIELVYGGGKVGLMGVIADAVLASGGRVTGVIPKALVERETAHVGLTTLVTVENMHERKQEMAKRADGFISMPGGAGTLEEAFEQWTWAQLGIHQKPNGFLNVNGYFEPLRSMVARIVEEGFIKPEHAEMITYSASPAEILDAFGRYTPPVRKWADAKPPVQP